MSARDWGLTIAVAVLLIDLLGLALDWLLFALDVPTISDVVWAGRWLGLVIGAEIVLLQLFIPLGLAAHFWGPK